MTTSLHFTMCARKCNDMFLVGFCVDAYTLLCLVISLSDARCSFQRVWVGIFSLNPDEGFAWSDGSPVSIFIFHRICLLKTLQDLYMSFLVFYSYLLQREHQSCKHLHGYNLYYHK